jgi:hypothetical protein
MSYQDEGYGTTSFDFVSSTAGAPFCIFLLALQFSSFYLHWALWKPFWKRFTDRAEGRVCRVCRVQTGSFTLKHAIIEYNVQGASMQRTFTALERESWSCSGKPSIGMVSLETFDAVEPLPLRLIPGLPGSALPELEWEIHQRPFPWLFYVLTIMGNAFVSCWLGAVIPFMEEGKWKNRSLVVTIALYVTMCPLADIVARRFALAEMKRQETTKDFTAPYNQFAFLFHRANDDKTCHTQLESLNTATAPNV